MTTRSPAANEEVIIEVALNGGTTTSTNPTVPQDPRAIAEQGIACLEAGASIVHSHPLSQVADESLREYVEAWSPIIAVCPDALLYPTARLGAPGETLAQTWGHNLELRSLGLARMSLVDPGSVNLGMRPDGTVQSAFNATVYVNSHEDTAHKLAASARHGLAPSISIFDPSFLRATIGFAAAGLLPAGSMVKLFFGADEMFGLRPTVAALDAYLELMTGTGFIWSAAVLGGDVFDGGFAELVLDRGGHLRVGLEDMHGPGTRTNLELVEQAAELVRSSGRQVAAPTRAMEILGCPSS